MSTSPGEAKVDVHTYEDFPRHGPDGVEIKCAQNSLFSNGVQSQIRWGLLQPSGLHFMVTQSYSNCV